MSRIFAIFLQSFNPVICLDGLDNMGLEGNGIKLVDLRLVGPPVEFQTC